MTPTRTARFCLPTALAALVLAGFLLWGLPAKAQPASTMPGPHRLALPVVFSNAAVPGNQLCRVGVGANPTIGDYEVAPLKLGWYLDWGVTARPARPGGIPYVPMIRLQKTSADTYSSAPTAGQLPGLVAMQPGALWVIGNEPDRVQWQDSLEPQLYARAYHDLYQVIKQTDPSARVAVAAVVEPTPLRLQYLDLVLDAYQAQYGRQPDGTLMPVDVWTVHGFILPEKSCIAYPADCWGAEIPPGVSATEGMLYALDDHDRLDIFKSFITTYRQWMAGRGYRNRPLLITELGILMPADYGFDAERVNRYMQGSFDYLMTATGATGYPPDDNRLVQGWAWYSLSDKELNGVLFDPSTRQRTVFGDKFVTLAQGIRGDVNFRPMAASATRVGSGAGEKVELTVTIANSGNSAVPIPFSLRVYQGNPARGGTPVPNVLLGGTLSGCGSTVTVTATWAGAPAGPAELWAVVDPANVVAERDESDNGFAFTLAAR